MQDNKSIFINSGLVEDIIYNIQKKLVDEFFLPYKKNEYLKLYGKEPDAFESLELSFQATDTFINYFMFGHCNVFAQILAETFQEDLDGILTATNDTHVIAKICNHYYDVRGLIDHKENIETFITRTKKEIEPLQNLAQYLAELAIGNYNENIDKQLIELGVAAAKERIQELQKINNNISEPSKHSI